MASGQNKVVKLYGPWKGVADADSEGNPSTFEIGYNVHSDGGVLSARGGRVPWSWLAGAGPVPIPSFACTVGGVDYWRQLSDADPDTYATGTLDASTVYVEIVSKVKLSGIRVGIKTANSGAVTLVPKYNSDSVGTMSSLTGVSDGTSSGGKTMAQTGNVFWIAPGSWPKMLDGTYRVRLYVSGAGYSAGTQISSLLCFPEVNPGARRLHHSDGGGVLHTGDGVAWVDFGQRVVGLLTDAEFTDGGIAKSVRIGRYGYCLDDLGRIVVLDEFTSTAKLLTAVQGSDSTTQAYQTYLPAFECLATYNNRLFGITYSGTVLFSSVENSYFIPTDGTAPYGGVHLWPSSNNFDIGPSFAGYGAETSGGYLYLFSSSRVYYYDENSLQQVPAGGGCLAPESVTSTPKGLAYVAPDGVRVLSGATSVLVSGGVSETIAEHIPSGGYSPSVGVCIPSLHEYRLFIPVRESAVPQAALVWDYESGEWYVWGNQPIWNEQDGKYAATSALVMQSVGGTERLLTCAPGLMTLVHDVSESDFDTPSASYSVPIETIVAFKPIGFGSDQTPARWRDIRIEAKSHGTKIRVAVLPDGVKFQEYLGSVGFQLADCPYLTTSIPAQALWSASPTDNLELFAGSDSTAVPRWSSWRIGQARLARTAQVVLFNGRYSADADNSPAIWDIRGIEIEARQGRGRR